MPQKDRQKAIIYVEELIGTYRAEQARLSELAHQSHDWKERTDLDNRAAACGATVERLEFVRRELLPGRRARRPARS
jgi:hypothetical protein